MVNDNYIDKTRDSIRQKDELQNILQKIPVSSLEISRGFEKLKDSDIKFNIKFKIKDIEFICHYKQLNCSGGAQDTSYNNLIAFIKNTTKEHVAEKNTIFLAICDGDYYLQKDSKTGDETKIKRLQRLTDGKTSFVLNIQELSGFLRDRL